MLPASACVVFVQLKFLEVSRLSFVGGLGPKLKEGMVEKRAGGRRVALHCCSCCACCQPGHWQKRSLLASFTLHLPLCQRLHSNISLNQNFMTTPALVLGCVLSHREPLTNTSHCRVHSFCPKDAGYMVWTFSVSCFRVTKAD